MVPDFRGLWLDSKNNLVRVMLWDIDKKLWVGIMSPSLDEREYDCDGIAKDGTKLMQRRRGGENL